MNNKDQFYPRRDSLGRKAVRLLQAGGGLTPLEIWIAAFLALLLTCATSALYELAKIGLKAALNQTPVAAESQEVISILLIALVAGGFFFAAVFYLKRWVNQMVDEAAPQTTVEPSPPVRVLVLFLSAPQDRQLPDLSVETLRQIESSNGGANSIRSAGVRLAARVTAYLDQKRGGGAEKRAGFMSNGWLQQHMADFNWRMPLEAIRYQLQQPSPLLERIVVVGSADFADKPGTHHVDEIFREFVLAEIGKNHPKVSVVLLADAMPNPFTYVRGKEELELDLKNGVAFNDFEALIAMLFRLSRTLREQKFRHDEILIDATGGQVPTSIAAAVFSVLVKGRKFQYVDTNSYAVRAFDVNHDFADLLDQA